MMHYFQNKKTLRTIFAGLKPNDESNDDDKDDKPDNGDCDKGGDDSFVDDGTEVGCNGHDRVTAR